MTGLFADQVRDARASGSLLAVTRLWVHTLIDLIATAPRQHLREEAPVLQPVESANVPANMARSPLIVSSRYRVGAGDPVARAVGSLLPGSWTRCSPIPPAVLGFPVGVVFMAFAGGMALVGWLVARRTRSVRVALGALTFLTLPALLLIVMTPALMLSSSTWPRSLDRAQPTVGRTRTATCGPSQPSARPRYPVGRPQASAAGPPQPPAARHPDDQVVPMKVGVAKETAPGERRVALVPEALGKLQAAGLEILVESGAGAGVRDPRQRVRRRRRDRRPDRRSCTSSRT